MEESDAEKASYQACAECTRECQITHGKGMARFPRFARPVPVYALPSETCSMQIPAPYAREYMPDLDKTEHFTLVGVTGHEWVVTFTRNAFRAGWKNFASDHRLVKGDMIMFTLIAPTRFSVCVFDSLGKEKFGTFLNSRDSLSASINTVLPLGPRNETPCTPCTPTSICTPKPYNDTCSPSSEKTSDDNEPLGSLFRKRALKEKDQLPHEPGENNEPEHSSSSQSKNDAVAVRLAKEVLLESNQTNLKKRKLSGELAVRIKSTLGTENPEVKISDLGVAILSTSIDPAGSPKGDVDETMFEQHAEDPIVGVSNGDKVTPDVGDEPQNLSNADPNQPEEVVGQTTPSNPRQNEALIETETARGATEEDAVLKGSETRQVEELLPSPVFQPRLVKQEVDPTIAEPHPYQACKNCQNCGLPKTPPQPRLKNLKSEPVTSENPETPEELQKIQVLPRLKVSNAPSTSTGRVTDYQKQQALKAARDCSTSAKAQHATVLLAPQYFNAKTDECFLSLQCAEMLPQTSSLVSLDCEGVSRKVKWIADKNCFEGPLWKAWFVEHKLQSNDVLYLELVKKSEQECVVRVTIFYAHKMEDAPVRSALAYTSIPALPGPKSRSSNLMYDSSQPSTSVKPKSVARRHQGVSELPELFTKKATKSSLSSPPTPRFATPATPTARSSPTTRRTKPSAPAVVTSEPPNPPPAASTVDAGKGTHTITISGAKPKVARELLDKRKS